MLVVLTCCSFHGKVVKAQEPSVEGMDKLHVLTLPGNTDAILLESDGYFGMIDSGEDKDAPDGTDSQYPLRSGTEKYGYGFENRVIEYMKKEGVTEENFVFYLGTHPHSDHIGSADEVIREFKPERVYIMEYKDEYISSPECLWDNLYVYDKMIAAAKDVGAILIQNFDEEAPVIPEVTQKLNNETEQSGENNKRSDDREYNYYTAEEIENIFGVDPENPNDPNAVSDVGEITIPKNDNPNSVLDAENSATTGNPNFMLGSMEINILNYSDDYKTTMKPDANYFSLGVLVKINGYKIFLAGDITNYDGDEDRLAPYIGHVDVLKMGHHGFSSSNTEEYFNILRPEYAIATGEYWINAAAPGRISMLDKLAQENGTRLYQSAECSSIVESIKIGFDKPKLECNMPSDAKMFFSCKDIPNLVCYRDGYKYSYNGWKNVGEKKYFFSNSAEACYSKWIYVDGKWYYCDTCGYVKTQWGSINGVWYYFNSNGIMQTGWQKTNGKWYYLNESGAMQTGVAENK